VCAFGKGVQLRLYRMYFQLVLLTQCTGVVPAWLVCAGVQTHSGASMKPRGTVSILCCLNVAHNWLCSQGNVEAFLCCYLSLSMCDSAAALRARARQFDTSSFEVSSMRRGPLCCVCTDVSNTGGGSCCQGCDTLSL
jgi:hypothetical protein